MEQVYIFESTAEQEEFNRLQTQSAAFDWMSQGRLGALGLGSGSACLEAGVGAGSMVRWMASAVGPTGKVVGVDLDDRFFAASAGPGVELLRDDLRTIELPDESFDFIHARLLLMHLQPPDRRLVLDRFLRWLKPGGHLLVVDPANDRQVTGEGSLGDLLTALVDAVRPNADFVFGVAAPALLTSVGFHLVESMLAFLRFTPPGLDDAFGDVTQTASLQALAAIRRFVVAAGNATDAMVDDVIGGINRGDITAGFPVALTWGQR